MATQTFQISNVLSSETAETADDPDRHPVRDVLFLPGAAR
jgi:hypothetical protein